MKSNKTCRKRGSIGNVELQQSPNDTVSVAALFDTENSEASRFESKCTSNEPQTKRLGSRTPAPCFNRNGVRGIYTLLPEQPFSYKPFNYARLRNGFYLMKVAKTDELVRYTYTEMGCIVRTVLFMYAFEHSPDCSMLELIHREEPYDFDEKTLQQRLIQNRGPMPLDYDIASRLLDECFGENFSTVVAFQVKNVLNEYNRTWRYSVCGAPIHIPSNYDYVLLHRFVNVPLCMYTDSTLFVNTNLRDNKILLQSNPKRFDSLRLRTLEEKYVRKSGNVPQTQFDAAPIN